MQKTIPVFLLSLSLASCINVKSDDGSIGDIFTGKKGNGPMTEKVFSGDFNSIEVSTSIDADIVKSDVEKVVISAPSDILEFVKVEQNGESVRIYVNSDYRNPISTERVKAVVYAKDFDELRANSSASVKVKDTFMQDKLKVDVSSSADVDGHLEANQLDISVGSSGSFSGKVWADYARFEVSSSGDFSVDGKVQHGSIHASSSGDFNGRNLEVKEGEFYASSSGSISAMVSQKASAKASSSGDVNLKKLGNPVISSSESSSGSVNVN